MIKYLPVAGFLLLIQLSGCKKNNEHNIFLSQSKVTFDYNDNQVTIKISNTGSGEFTWNIQSSSEYLKFSKTTGLCARNEPDNFDILLSREKIHSDSISTSVTITTSSGESASISVFIHGYPESKIRYNSTVLDADYDYANNRLILLGNSSGKYFLDIYDIGQGSFDQILINNYMSYLSVSQDGTYAIVGSNSGNYISYIDLIQNKIVNTYSTESYIGNSIASSGKLVYCFSEYSDYGIGRLDLNTGSYATFDLGSYLSIDAAELHPSGSFIYACGYSTLYKFAINASEPQLVYSNSNYNMGSGLWISRDGSKIFNANKKILSINPQLTGDDITQVATLNMWQNYIYLIRQNPVRNEYYVVPTTSSSGTDNNSNQILVFSNTFEQTSTIQLEKFFTSEYYDGSYRLIDAIAKYLFVSTDGSKIIVISRSNDSNYSYYWGIQIIDR
ncbi:MAG: hypothetical protein NTX61_15930 [Bacteroidetes bacterium]|nr:hypothetical protein [Bacteroidota bacterium]